MNNYCVATCISKLDSKIIIERTIAINLIGHINVLSWDRDVDY